MFDPITLVTALLPAVSDGVRGLINKWTGGAGAKPANVEEAVKLMGAEVDRLRALAELDKPEGVSTWVANIRALQRPTAVLLILISWIGVGFWSQDENLINITSNLAASVVFYLFGDRTYMYFKKGG